MLTIPLDTSSTQPMYEQIYHYIKNEIQQGKLPYNTKLPSTRSLASHLQISRTTVDMAYGQLLSEGYLESIPKCGFYVSQIGDLTTIKPFVSKKNISSMVEETPNYLYDFSPFSVDLDHFPYSTWRLLSKNCLNHQNDLFLQGSNQGDETFREAICNYVHQSRGVHCSKEQIIIGAGVDYLLQLLSLLFPPNSCIAMENPTYKRAYHIFSGLHIPTKAIPLDEGGIQIKDLIVSKANIAYVTPSHQYPIGIVMPIHRRFELLEWASQKANRYIIEDDHDSEFRYKGKPIPSLQGIDSNEKVIYIGTFSKAIAPAIRVGYMILPPILLEQYHSNYNYYSSTVSRIDQAILTSFINQGYFERHLNRMRKIYKSKHDLFLQTLKVFGDSIHIYGDHAGLHVMMQVHSSFTESNILTFTQEYGIKLYGLFEHFITENQELPICSPPTFLMGYANLKEKEIVDGTTALFHLWTTHGII